MLMQKKLYFVSLGPGSPELLTLKAILALIESDVIIVPTSCADGSFDRSRAFDILKGLNQVSHDILHQPFKLESKIIKPIYCPRQYKVDDWHKQIELIIEGLNEKNVVSYVTLGDAGIYSTVYYLIHLIEKEKTHINNWVEVIPGITSFSEASAKVKKPLCLGSSKLEILPLAAENLKTTRVYMRPKIGDTLNNLSEEGELLCFENLTFDDESYFEGKPEKVKGYMTLLIDFAISNNGK